MAIGIGNISHSQHYRTRTRTRTETLHAAEKAVNGDRQGDYGTPENNFKNIAGFWSLYLSSKLNKDITLQAVDVAVLLDLMKTARLIQSPGKTDTWIDKAGYAACGAEIVSETPPTVGQVILIPRGQPLP